jgi:hypothetical protein
MAKSQRRTPEQQIEYFNKRILEIKQKLRQQKSSRLTLKSDGIQSVLDSLVYAAKVNKAKVGEILELTSRLKRTGLKIEPRQRVKRKQPVAV